MLNYNYFMSDKWQNSLGWFIIHIYNPQLMCFVFLQIIVLSVLSRFCLETAALKHKKVLLKMYTRITRGILEQCLIKNWISSETCFWCAACHCHPVDKLQSHHSLKRPVPTNCVFIHAASEATRISGNGKHAVLHE